MGYLDAFTDIMKKGRSSDFTEGTMNEFNLLPEEEKIKYIQAIRLTDEEAFAYFGDLESKLEPEVIAYIKRKKARLNNKK
jgi:hypothetical protein